MNAFVGSRASGKTRKLLEYAKENNLVIVCKNPSAMMVKAHAYGITGLKFVGYGETLDEEANHAIDDIESFLESLRIKVSAYSSTIED